MGSIESAEVDAPGPAVCPGERRLETQSGEPGSLAERSVQAKLGQLRVEMLPMGLEGPRRPRLVPAGALAAAARLAEQNVPPERYRSKFAGIDHSPRRVMDERGRRPNSQPKEQRDE